MALQSPPPTFFRIYKRIITDFLWGNKVAKIAYAKLVQGYGCLGLKLVDLECKDLALKASWPIQWRERNFSEIEWFFQTFPIKDQRIWDCNISPNDLNTQLDSNFMATSNHILYTWCKLNYKPVLEESEEILNSTLWANSLIHRANKLFYG